jgi:hypothetical protein
VWKGASEPAVLRQAKLFATWVATASGIASTSRQAQTARYVCVHAAGKQVRLTKAGSALGIWPRLDGTRRAL